MIEWIVRFTTRKLYDINNRRFTYIHSIVNVNNPSNNVSRTHSNTNDSIVISNLVVCRIGRFLYQNIISRFPNKATPFREDIVLNSINKKTVWYTLTNSNLYYQNEAVRIIRYGNANIHTITRQVDDMGKNIYVYPIVMVLDLEYDFKKDEVKLTCTLTETNLEIRDGVLSIRKNDNSNTLIRTINFTRNYQNGFQVVFCANDQIFNDMIFDFEEININFINENYTISFGLVIRWTMNLIALNSISTLSGYSVTGQVKDLVITSHLYKNIIPIQSNTPHSVKLSTGLKSHMHVLFRIPNQNQANLSTWLSKCKLHVAVYDLNTMIPVYVRTNGPNNSPINASYVYDNNNPYSEPPAFQDFGLPSTKSLSGVVFLYKFSSPAIEQNTEYMIYLEVAYHDGATSQVISRKIAYHRPYDVTFEIELLNPTFDSYFAPTNTNDTQTPNAISNLQVRYTATSNTNDVKFLQMGRLRTDGTQSNEIRTSDIIWTAPNTNTTSFTTTLTISRPIDNSNSVLNTEYIRYVISQENCENIDYENSFRTVINYYLSLTTFSNRNFTNPFRPSDYVYMYLYPVINLLVTYDFIFFMGTVFYDIYPSGFRITLPNYNYVLTLSNANSNDINIDTIKIEKFNNIIIENNLTPVRLEIADWGWQRYNDNFVVTDTLWITGHHETVCVADKNYGILMQTNIPPSYFKFVRSVIRNIGDTVIDSISIKVFYSGNIVTNLHSANNMNIVYNTTYVGPNNFVFEFNNLSNQLIFDIDASYYNSNTNNNGCSISNLFRPIHARETIRLDVNVAHYKFYLFSDEIAKHKIVTDLSFKTINHGNTIITDITRERRLHNNYIIEVQIRKVGEDITITIWFKQKYLERINMVRLSNNGLVEDQAKFTGKISIGCDSQNNIIFSNNYTSVSQVSIVIQENCFDPNYRYQRFILIEPISPDTPYSFVGIGDYNDNNSLSSHTFSCNSTIALCLYDENLPEPPFNFTCNTCKDTNLINLWENRLVGARTLYARTYNQAISHNNTGNNYKAIIPISGYVGIFFLYHFPDNEFPDQYDLHVTIYDPNNLNIIYNGNASKSYHPSYPNNSLDPILKSLYENEAQYIIGKKALLFYLTISDVSQGTNILANEGFYICHACLIRTPSNCDVRTETYYIRFLYRTEEINILNVNNNSCDSEKSGNMMIKSSNNNTIGIQDRLGNNLSSPKPIPNFRAWTEWLNNVQGYISIPDNPPSNFNLPVMLEGNIVYDSYTFNNELSAIITDDYVIVEIWPFFGSIENIYLDANNITFPISGLQGVITFDTYLPNAVIRFVKYQQNLRSIPNTLENATINIVYYYENIYHTQICSNIVIYYDDSFAVSRNNYNVSIVSYSLNHNAQNLPRTILFSGVIAKLKIYPSNSDLNNIFNLNGPYTNTINHSLNFTYNLPANNNTTNPCTNINNTINNLSKMPVYNRAIIQSTNNQLIIRFNLFDPTEFDKYIEVIKDVGLINVLGNQTTLLNYERVVSHITDYYVLVTITRISNNNNNVTVEITFLCNYLTTNYRSITGYITNAPALFAGNIRLYTGTTLTANTTINTPANTVSFTINNANWLPNAQNTDRYIVLGYTKNNNIGYTISAQDRETYVCSSNVTILCMRIP